MESDTSDRLSAINRRFYASEAALEFSRSRRRPWLGWEKLLSRLPLESGARVLDAGCGDGRFADYLARRGQRVRYHGIDTSPRLLSLARGRALGDWAHFELADLSSGRLPWPHRDFELIALFGVLHHIAGERRRSELLRTLAGFLAPRGCLCVTVWRFDREPGFARRVLDWSTYNASSDQPVRTEDLEEGDTLLRWGNGGTRVRYCHFPSDAELERCWRSAGLTVEDHFTADGRGDRLNDYFLLYCGP